MTEPPTTPPPLAKQCAPKLHQWGTLLEEYSDWGMPAVKRYTCATCGCWGWNVPGFKARIRPYRDGGGLVFSPRPGWFRGKRQMRCSFTRIGDGVVVICGMPKPKLCSVPGCYLEHVALCDWKLKPPAKRATCSARLCASHTTKPAPKKDLCPAHATMWKEWEQRRAAGGQPR